MPAAPTLPPPPDKATGGRLYLRPIALDRAWGLPLAGGPLRFSAVEVIVRSAGTIDRATAPLAELDRWSRAHGIGADCADRLDRLTRPRTPIAGPAADGPLLMGIINVTPDSFSDGGRFFGTAQAVDHGLALRRAGADILDVGGESTRPGADPVTAEEEMARVLPVVSQLAAAGALVSIDTRRAAVMSAAIAAGARMINDVTALTCDPDSLSVAAASGLPIVLMHMQGEPQTMQAAPHYGDAALDIFDYLEGRLAACAGAGIAPTRLIVDPGIGFGKTLGHNLSLLDKCAVFHGLGCPVLVGVSRKSFIAKASHGEPADRRMPGSLAAAQAALDRGVQILRVHDVEETAQARTIWQAIGRAA